MKNNILEEVIEVMKECASWRSSEIDAHKTLEQLGLDFETAADILLKLEEKFGICTERFIDVAALDDDSINATFIAGRLQAALSTHQDSNLRLVKRWAQPGFALKS